MLQKIIAIFGQLGFNEADTIKSSSMLIYSNTEHRIDTGMIGLMPYKIKWN